MDEYVGTYISPYSAAIAISYDLFPSNYCTYFKTVLFSHANANTLPHPPPDPSAYIRTLYCLPYILSDSGAYWLPHGHTYLPPNHVSPNALSVLLTYIQTYTPTDPHSHPRTHNLDPFFSSHRASFLCALICPVHNSHGHSDQRAYLLPVYSPH